MNEDGLLEIQKEFQQNSLKLKTFIIANHPTDEKAKDLLTLKTTDLKRRAKELEVTNDYNTTMNHEIRKAIRKHIFCAKEPNFAPIPIDTTKEGRREIWSKLSS